jgi:ribosomal protein L11 methyltransferase
LWSLLFRRYDDELVANLWEAGTAGILEENEGLRAYFAEETSRAGLAHLGGQFRAEDQNISWAVQQDWEPISIGERLLIVPPGFNGEVPEGRLALPLELGAAFGTGRHESTQLCLEAMEQWITADQIVLDAGCGSGILSAGAHLLGARSVFSCDIDRNAVELTRRHVSTPVFVGSADAVAPKSVDLVLANLTAAILDGLAWDLQRITKPGGTLLITGFLGVGPPHSFHPRQEFERNGWLCWMCSPEHITPLEPPAAGLTHKPEWWL